MFKRSYNINIKLDEILNELAEAIKLPETKEEINKLMVKDRKDFFKSTSKKLPTVDEITTIKDYLKYWCEILKLDFTVNEKTFNQLIKEIKNKKLDN